MLKFRNYPLFWKLILPMVSTTMLWASIVVIATSFMIKSRSEGHSLYTQNVVFVLELQTLARNFSHLNQLLLEHVSSADGQQIKVLHNKIQKQTKALKDQFESLQKLTLDHHNHSSAEFADIFDLYRQYLKKSSAIILLSEDFEKFSANELLQKTTSDFQTPINHGITSITDTELTFMQEYYEQLHNIWKKYIIILAVTGGVTFVTTLFFLYWIIAGITRRFSMVSLCADKLSKGDLSARVEKNNYDDEISHLGLGLATMAKKIHKSTNLRKESEDQVRLLLDFTAEAIYGIDLAGKCTFSNIACLQTLGYQSASELLGQNIHQLIHHSYPDGTPYPVEDCHVHKSIVSRQKTYQDEEVLWRKDGSKFSVEYRSHPIHKEGKVIGAVISFHDTTEQRATEEALQKSRNSLNDAQAIGHVGSWEWDIKRNTITWADETYRIFGFSPQEVTITYDTFLGKIHPEDKKFVEHAVQDALNRKSLYDINHRIILTDGSERIVNEKGKITLDKDGTPRLMIGTIQDITNIKKVENDLRTYQEKLETLVAERTMELQTAKEEADKANQAKSLFLSSMSHELRTPLNSVLGFGQLLFTDKKNPVTIEQKKQLQNILKSGNHLLDLIDGVLNLSKIESGAVEIVLEPVEVHSLLRETIELVQETAKTNNIKISQKDSGKPVFIHVDNRRFRQVLMNLVSNAIKYNRPGGTVCLSCEESASQLKIMVSDTGFGISTKKSPLLFEPFSRLGAETSSIEGTGIGLTITKQLVELMNGHIGFESEVDKGSTFWVDFPIYIPQEEHPTFVQKAKQSEPSLPEGHYTILYIEDNQFNRDLLLAILSRTPSLKLLMAENGTQGVAMAIQSKPDLIFMDISLPDMDGFAALQILRQHKETENIPTVALSGNAIPNDIKKALQAGFVQYITKPFNIADLYRVISELINELPKSDLERKK